jgi:transposase
LAVSRVLEGYSTQEVAAFLGVSEPSVHRWIGACRQSGKLDALKAKPMPGRPRKLTAWQEKTVLGWLTKSPAAFGFAGELWTLSATGRTQIEWPLGVCFNANYLVAWLTARRHSAQKPDPRAKEQDDVAVARWLAEDWPRIQKKPKPSAPTSC